MISALLILAFAFHFSLVLIHQFGMDRLPKPITAFTERYIVPWFYQNYKLFAPDPTDKINTFMYRLHDKDGWTEWVNPVYPYQQSHWSNRLGTGSDYYDIYNGIADLLYDGAHVVQFKEKPIATDWHSLPAFQLAQKAVYQHLAEEEIAADSFQVAVHTSLRRISEEGRVEKRALFQTYPIKAIQE